MGIQEMSAVLAKLQLSMEELKKEHVEIFRQATEMTKRRWNLRSKRPQTAQAPNAKIGNVRGLLTALTRGHQLLQWRGEVRQQRG